MDCNVEIDRHGKVTPRCEPCQHIAAQLSRLRDLVEKQGKIVEAARAACAEDDESGKELRAIDPKYDRESIKVKALKAALLALKEAEGEK